jgi:ZIP family zinc transporter
VSGGDVVVVFLAALGTALATGLGALPLLAVRSAGRVMLGATSAAAAGVMLAASFSLAWEGSRQSVGRTAAGIVLGGAFIVVAGRLLRHDRDLSIGALRGGDARKALLIVAVMTVHSAAEGIGVGAAFGKGETLGILIAVAIAVHNIPEGLAISLVLVPRGVSVPKAAGWSVFSSLPQPLLAVPAFLFVEEFDRLLAVGLGFAAGAMIWMVIRELLPEALEAAPLRIVAGACTAAFGAMLLFQIWLL